MEHLRTLWKQATASLYRGIRAEVPVAAIASLGFATAVEREVVAESRRMGGVGVHWSRSREVAERFAQASALSRGEVLLRVVNGELIASLPVVLEGKPRMSDLLDDAEKARGVMYLVMPDSDEDEVPIVRGAQIPIDRVWVDAPSDALFTLQANRFARTGTFEPSLSPISQREVRFGITMKAGAGVRELGPSPLDYDVGRPERIGIIDQSAGPAKPGETYFTSEPVEEVSSRMKRQRWDDAPEGAKPTKRKPAPVYVENSGRAQVGLVAFLDWSYRGDSIYIHFMNTRRDCRGRGYGTDMITWVYDKAIREGRRVDWGRVFYDAQRLFDSWRAKHPDITSGRYA